jgi:uncharacterized RmlC-like cupin family protein
MSKDMKTCCVIKPEDSYQGKQALTYFNGISAETAGAQGICMHLLTIPPGGKANAHLHENHETAIYVISGKAHMWYGKNLSEHLAVEADKFL